MKRILVLLLMCGSGSSAQTPSFKNFLTLYKPVTKPILRADSSLIFFDSLKNSVVKWQRADVFNPGAVVKDGKVYLLTRSEDNPAAAIGGRTSRLGLAVSSDGYHFKQFKEPVLYPANDSMGKYDFPGGCEDPRVVETEDGQYVMAYTSWNYQVPRLSIALSKDLFHWQKKGPAFTRAYNGKYKDKATKSASMITQMKGGRLVLAKLNGKYWMYWGETFVNLAWSTNLYNWYPLQDEHDDLIRTMETRPGMFDGDLTECGPPAIITDAGILLLYNGKNATTDPADPALARGTYSVGYALFDTKKPGKLIRRASHYLLKPSLPHEITGQYKAGTVFSEGLVFFKSKWFLYYGTADSYIGLAVTR